MKILHVIPVVAPRYGGPSHTIFGMCKALVRQGQQVTLFTTNHDGPDDLDVPLDRPVEIDGVEVRYFQVQPPRSYHFSLPLARALEKEVKRFDIVHIHSVFNWPITPASFFCRRDRVPYIVRPCGILDPVPLKKAYGDGWLPVSFDFKRRYITRKYLKPRYLKSLYQRRAYFKKILYLHLVEKRNLEGAAAIHFTSNQEMRASLPYGLGPPSFVIPLGIDPEAGGGSDSKTAREIYPSLDGKKVILFLSRLDAKKGLNLLIPALASLTVRQKNFVFVLAGSGEPNYEKEIREHLYKYGLLDRTLMTSFVEGDTKWSILRSADIFVLPSYHENFGVAVVEALALGVPVVISDQVGVHEEVSKYEAGIVTACDSHGISDALNVLLENEGLRKAMGKNGKRLVSEKFAWKKVASSLVNSYKSIFSGSLRRAEI